MGDAPLDADPSPPTGRLFALKHGDSFVVADSRGDISGDADGLFFNDTRLLSRFRLRIADRLPTLCAVPGCAVPDLPIPLALASGCFSGWAQGSGDE